MTAARTTPTNSTAARRIPQRIFRSTLNNPQCQ
jgi:hypothetical protein